MEIKLIALDLDGTTLRKGSILSEETKIALEEAILKGINVVIAVSDQAGRIVAVHSMDDAYIASYDIAVNKTFTAAGFKMSTAELAKLAQPGQPLYGIQHTNEGKIVIFGGGEPLEVEGKIIGALGVSGGTAEQDITLATYGKEVFKEVIRGC